jgi:hypothetical protein
VGGVGGGRRLKKSQGGHAPARGLRRLHSLQVVYGGRPICGWSICGPSNCRRLRLRAINFLVTGQPIRPILRRSSSNQFACGFISG